MTVAPREAFAKAAREAIECHDEWDSPHCFQALHWDGTDLSCRTYVCIMPDIHPEQYPALMAKAAREELEKHPDDPACGYLLQIESFGLAEPGKDASEAEREAYERARITRTFSKHPDAVETVIAWAADIHGRLWSAGRIRGKDSISETFCPPGKAPGGHMISGLLAVAYTTGTLAWGLPGPQGPLN